MKTGDGNKPNNAKAAMLDYFDDMFGSIENDPLQKLVDDEKVSNALPLDQNKRKLNIAKPKVKKSSHASLLKAKETTKPLPTFYDEAYETSLKAELVTPLIIPAAFPKLAPKETSEPEAKPSQEQNTTNDETQTAKTVELKLETPILNQVEVKKVAQPEPIKPTKNISKVEFVPNLKDSRSNIQQTQTGVNESALLSKNSRPDWSTERFECLLFSVAGLKLAVPLISLGAIYKIENDFTPLVGRASWFMGLYRYDDRNVRVIDTAQLVMPDRVMENTRENYRYIIRLGGNNWGIACDSVQESILLEPEEVKWRSERTKRAWLSGTVIEHMCALVDVNGLTDILKKEALSRRSSLIR